MKTKLSRSFTLVILLTLALTGCHTTRSTRSMTDTPATFTRKQRNALLTPLAQYPTDVQAVTAKTSIAFNYEGYSATVKGRLRMRRDEGVQMSITALGLMEIACIEFTPQGAYIIDRVNKRYVVFDYSSGWMNLAGINFNTIQSLFWNRIFIPGEKEVWRKTDSFTMTDNGASYLVEPSRQRTLKCQFHTDADCKELQQTKLNLKQYAATWGYGRFETTDDYTYPTTHDVSVSGSSRSIGANINLSNISTLDTGWDSTTDLSRYKEVDVDQLMSILKMLK